MKGYYTNSYNQKNNANFQAIHAGTGAALLLTLGIICAVKMHNQDVLVDTSTPEPTAISTLIPESVEPAVVIPKYRSLLTVDVRDCLDDYLNQSPSHTCEDLNSRGVTNADKLRLRKGPGTEYGIITELEDKTSLQILGVCDNNWYLVQADGQVGFVYGDYLQSLSSEYIQSQMIQPSTHFLKAVRAKSGVNVRDNPNADTAEIIGGLLKNQYAAASERLDNGWYRIYYGDQIGYVSGDFVEEVYATSLEDLPMIYTRFDAPCYQKPYDFTSDVTIPQNQFLRIFGENDEYFLVEYNGSYYYVEKSNCIRMSDFYAIVDISDQTLKVYHLGEEIISTRVVTGKDSTPTDIGFFTIYRKESDVTMTGEDYSVYVDEALFYNGGEAIHRSERGDWDYTHDVHHEYGSHGCVNTPPKVMKKIFETLNQGDRVFVQE